MKPTLLILLGLVFGFILSLFIALRPLCPADAPDAWTLCGSTNGYAYRDWSGYTGGEFASYEQAGVAMGEHRIRHEKYKAAMSPDRVRGWWR